MTDFKTLDDFSAKGLRVLMRVDLNVPTQGGEVTDTTRIERIVPSITELSRSGARIVLLSHFGRPGGRVEASLSLAPVVGALTSLLDGITVRFATDCVGTPAQAVIDKLDDGNVAILENLRFHAAEENNAPDFCRALGKLGDVYVNEAFSVSHRAHASVDGLARLLPAYAGRLMQAELDALALTLAEPERPVAAIVGGAKVSTKLALLENLVTRVDHLIIAGGMANTFLLARGIAIGTSLAEHALANSARQIETRAADHGCEILLQSDAVVAERLAANVFSQVVSVTDVPDNRMILDVGPDSVRTFAACLRGCRTVLWNGPLGAFEIPPFDNATGALASTVGDLTRRGALLSVAGGGDTVSALSKAGVQDQFTYLSTAGGAFLEWLEGRDLPGIAALRTCK